MRELFVLTKCLPENKMKTVRPMPILFNLIS
ncbi:hypothetical protein BM43_7542 (plasmid) [Burkholderia gladioli]|uniref:Uncharacterized protein n=1 Tax=Burkholderia gladioli TaxID=28095 RepID=A0AAW3FAP2_BURGA|nr:hypothetical protein BM43_7542 [Burkholderia gladioli]KGC24069.1 hypothetical protein DM48_8011 [Burkholderia gladioli]